MAFNIVCRRQNALLVSWRFHSEKNTPAIATRGRLSGPVWISRWMVSDWIRQSTKTKLVLKRPIGNENKTRGLRPSGRFWRPEMTAAKFTYRKCSAKSRNKYKAGNVRSATCSANRSMVVFGSIYSIVERISDVIEATEQNLSGNSAFSSAKTFRP